MGQKQTKFREELTSGSPNWTLQCSRPGESAESIDGYCVSPSVPV
jgi:hypothetical protein